MIDKYAEIQYRITLYNACKGILRVKQANMWGTALSTLSNWGGKAMSAANAAGKAMKPVGNAISTAGKTVGAYANKATNAVGKGLNWLGDSKVKATMGNIQNATNTVQGAITAGSTGLALMGQMKGMGVADAQNDLATRRTQLENARLDMVEKQLNSQRNAMGLGNVGEEAEAEGADEGDAAQQSQFGAQAAAR